MKKRILGVVGSPRKKGNTDVLVSRILAGAKSEGAKTDHLYLKNKVINPCNGCHTCWKGKDCNKKDDMNRFYPKIIQSDILILGTPVYWYGPTAMMKGFIDRFVYFNCPEHRVKIRGKSVVIVIPFEENDIKTAAPVVEFFKRCLNYLEMDLAGEIIVPGVTKPGEVRSNQTMMEKAFQLGVQLTK